MDITVKLDLEAITALAQQQINNAFRNDYHHSSTGFRIIAEAIENELSNGSVKPLIEQEIRKQLPSVVTDQVNQILKAEIKKQVGKLVKEMKDQNTLFDQEQSDD